MPRRQKVIARESICTDLNEAGHREKGDAAYLLLAAAGRLLWR